MKRKCHRGDKTRAPSISTYELVFVRHCGALKHPVIYFLSYDDNVLLVSIIVLITVTASHRYGVHSVGDSIEFKICIELK